MSSYLDVGVRRQINGRLFAVAFFLAVLALEVGLVVALAGPPVFDPTVLAMP